MFLELLNNAFTDSSLFYLYFGIILVSFGAMHIIHFHNNNPLMDDYLFVDKHQNIKISLTYMEKALITTKPFLDWLILTFKRIDEKDDKEDNSFSYFNRALKIRGGQLWKKTACSQPLKNIVF